jgi:hypothetical protein
MFFIGVVYTVEVHTGNELAADTEANVFITMYGERGDSGKRVLFKSKENTTKFKVGQVRSCIAHQLFGLVAAMGGLTWVSRKRS